MSNIVELNVGGTYLSTTRFTLNAFPESMLRSMFLPENESMRVIDNKGRVFIDADPVMFSTILNLARRQLKANPDEPPLGISKETWLQELDYWQFY